jgi:hypothetical protein
MRRLMLSAILLIGLFSWLSAQDLYDPAIVQEVRLYFTQSNWDYLLEQLYLQGEERLIGTAVINGVPFDSVGVRYKGNSTYSPIRAKNPFNIKLDYVINGQKYGPYGTLRVSNGFMDPTLVREPLAYEIARKYFPASKSNYANIYVNDVLQGIYTNDQDPDNYFGEVHYFTGNNTRIKGEIASMSPFAIWGYINDIPASYANYYVLDSGLSMMPFIDFLDIFNNTPSQMESVLNVDRHLWFLAFENCFVNLDSPINNGQNYYVYEDINNRFNPLPWDLNECFGAFTNMQTMGNLNVTQMQNLSPLANSTHANYPILSRMLSVPMYKRMYIAHMRTMLEENISNGWYLTRALELQAICGPSVQADPNYLFSYANFLANINTTVTGSGTNPRIIVGITQLMDARATYLLNCAAFSGTVPTISATNFSPQEILPNSTLTVTASTANASTAYLGWRQNHTVPFQRVQMFDDGAHGDGTAGDGIFGVHITISVGNIEYYIYAENTQQGKFLPARAEYEFLTIPVLVEPGELVINEIMAKNLSYADPFGEFDDWVEIYNPQDYAIDIGGMYMTDSNYVNGISAWTQIPASAPAVTTIQPHGFLVVWFDENTAQGPLHINTRLGGLADAVYLIDSDGVTVVDSYTWTEATGLDTDDVSIGRMPDGGTIWQLFGTGQAFPSTPGATNVNNPNYPPSITNIHYTPNPAAANVPITISAVVTDADNNLATVELLWGQDDYTLNTSVMVLSNVTYSASVGQFAADSVIQFRIRATDAMNAVSLSQPPLLHSSRHWATDAMNAVSLSQVYNITVGFQSPILCINEVMAFNTATITDEAGEYEDWVEIYNPNSFPVNMAGYYMGDSHFGEMSYIMNPFPSDFPAATTIPAGGYVLVWFDEELIEGPLHVNTRLGTTGDTVYLVAPDMLTIVDNASWDVNTGMAADISYGRYPNGTEYWSVFGGPNPHPVTPGTSNSPNSVTDDNIPGVLPVLNIYPNPSSGILNIDVKNTKTASLVGIYNLKGQLIKATSIMPGEKAVWDGIDLNGKRIGDGIYLVKVLSGKLTITRKICILTSNK